MEVDGISGARSGRADQAPACGAGAYDAVMRDAFWSFYWPSSEDLDALWGSAEIVLDASALLSLHRYREDTREELLEILRNLSDRLWVPHQAALEYQRNRAGVILQHMDPILSLRKAVDRARDGLMGEAEKLQAGRHPSLDREALVHVIGQSCRRLETYVDRCAEALPQPSGKHVLEGDETWAAVTTLLDGRIGRNLGAEDLEAVQKDAQKRIEGRIPPGYADSDKAGPERYGDMIIWHQMIEHAKESHRSQIFVTDDGKEDWWWTVHGVTLGPRRELIEEMREKSAVGFYAYRPDRFLAHAREYLNQRITDRAIEEVAQTSQPVVARLTVRDLQAYLAAQQEAQAALEALRQSQGIEALRTTQAVLDALRQGSATMEMLRDSGSLLDALRQSAAGLDALRESGVSLDAMRAYLRYLDLVSGRPLGDRWHVGLPKERGEPPASSGPADAAPDPGSDDA
jgi:hypothetical protein